MKAHQLEFFINKKVKAKISDRNLKGSNPLEVVGEIIRHKGEVLLTRGMALENFGLNGILKTSSIEKLSVVFQVEASKPEAWKR